ncbi:MAG: biotin/lipoyl-containing protein, partial [Candidatus Dormibacteria bacterium]
MAMTVTMPQLGESVTEGTIARWLKQPGEQVAKYESIAEVVTDKVNAEIPAPADGSMGEHIAKEGEVVAVGQPICTLETVEQAQANSAWHQGDGGGQAQEGAVSVVEQAAQAPGQPAPEQAAQPESVAREGPAEQPQQPAAEPLQAAAPQPQQAAAPPPQPAPATSSASPATPSGGGNGSGQYHITPAVRMLVREHEVDLSQVEGSGLGGRVSKRDVLDYVQRRDAGGGAARPSAPVQQQPAAASPAQPLGAAPGPAAQPRPTE